MTYEQNFLKDFQEWVDQQVQISELAMKAAEKILFVSHFFSY